MGKLDIQTATDILKIITAVNEADLDFGDYTALLCTLIHNRADDLQIKPTEYLAVIEAGLQIGEKYDY